MRLFTHRSGTARVAALAASCLVISAAAAAEPSALVEDISSDRTDVQLMDYLEPGQVIELGTDETLVLGYLFSCIQETITGGQVTIGEDRSAVQGGSVESMEVDCDGGPVVGSVGGAEEEAGAATFRVAGGSELPTPDRLIFGLSPIVKLSKQASTLVIRRLDKEEPVRNVAAAGAVVDLFKEGISLDAGGTYTVEADDRTIVFRVSSFAEPGEVAAVGRLLPF